MMSSKCYYGDLSGASSSDGYDYDYDEDSNSSDLLDDLNDIHSRRENPDTDRYSNIWDRSIIHLDIDCFYCQCEEIDRNLRNIEPVRPLAIGQKHIIVTCNYEARKRGVKKLQLRQDAILACPDLFIVEGSDLKSYRYHSRKVYESFRNALNEISTKLFDDDDDDKNHDNNLRSHHKNKASAVVLHIPARKGTMDEMIADLSPAIKQMMMTTSTEKQNKNNNIFFEKEEEIHGNTQQTSTLFVYGETAESSQTRLVEDQTGQEIVVSYNTTTKSNNNDGSSLSETRRNIHESFGTQKDRELCIQRLNLAASQLAMMICNYIKNETGFNTTAGISVSPLLAKIASDLNKPKSINILYPWRSSQLIYSMPLRKMNLIGYGIVKALTKHMSSQSHQIDITAEGNDNNNKKDKRIVRDLLEMPRNDIIKSLQGMQAFQSSSEEKCDFLIDRCRGLDETVIIDDEGEAQKTLSIENSFRRGSVTTMEAIWRGLLDLFVRLPLLLRDRASWSGCPSKAYPMTIRLTIRRLDQNLVVVKNNSSKRRRPFVTHSKQAPIDGKRLLDEKDPKVLIQILKHSISPLLHQLLQQSKIKDINITRMNIALTNFQDIVINSSRSARPTSGRESISSHFQPIKKRRFDETNIKQESATNFSDPRRHKDCKVSPSQQKEGEPTVALHTKKKKDQNIRKSSRPRIGALSYVPSVASVGAVAVSSTTKQNVPSASFPSKKKRHQRSTNSTRPPRTKSTRIDHFFWKK